SEIAKRLGTTANNVSMRVTRRLREAAKDLIHGKEPQRGMMRDKLSRREDRAFLKALRAVALTQFPNPDRKDCPGAPTLHAIATKRISMFDSAHEHVGSCSPCFKELTDIRRALQRRKILLCAMGTTGTAILVFAVWLTYFRFQRLDNPPRPQTVQSVQ